MAFARDLGSKAVVTQLYFMPEYEHHPTTYSQGHLAITVQGVPSSGCFIESKSYAEQSSGTPMTRANDDEVEQSYLDFSIVGYRSRSTVEH